MRMWKCRLNKVRNEENKDRMTEAYNRHLITRMEFTTMEVATMSMEAATMSMSMEATMSLDGWMDQ